MTSAPMSPSMSVQYGPASARVRSMTHSWSSGPAMSRFLRAAWNVIVTPAGRLGQHPSRTMLGPESQEGPVRQMVPLDLHAVQQEVLTCTRCRLSETRISAVPGEGAPDARVLFVCEGPGGREDESGRPFVSPA